MLFLQLLLVVSWGYTVTFVADPHYDPLYEDTANPSESCRAGGGSLSNFTFPYGQYKCGVTNKTLDVLAKSLINTTKGTDIAFMIGDVILGKHASRDEHDQAIKAVYDKVRTGLKVPFYPVLGNTEFYGIDQASTNDAILAQIKRIADLTGLKAVSAQAYQQFLKGGYYSIKSGKLTIIVLNTGLYNSLQKRSEDDPMGQLAFLRKELEGCHAAKGRALIIQHIPLMVSTYTGSYTMQQKYSDTLRSIYCEFFDIIANIHAAEDHRDEFKLVYCSKVESGIPLFMLPAISPNRNNNPAYRIAEFSSKTGNLMNYKQYYLDLGLANIKMRQENVYTRHRDDHNSSVVTFVPEYRFSDEYGPAIMKHMNKQDAIVASMDAQGWGTYAPMRALYLALQNDPDVWSIFYSHMGSLRYDRKTSFICAARAITTESYKSCMAQLQ